MAVDVQRVEAERSEIQAVVRPRLLREPDYLALLAGQGISSLGDAATFVALPLLVLLQTGSGVLMGIVGILETVPDLVFGPLAGVYADRWDRRRLMVGADLGRAILTALIPLSAILGLPVIAVVLLVVGPINVLRVFFTAALSATIPAVSGRDRLAAGSGYLEAVYALGYILGPAFAGLLITLVGPGPTLAVDAASFLLSAAGILLVRRSLRPPHAGTRPRLREELLVGLRYVWHDDVLRPAIGFVAAFNLATAAFVPAFTFAVVRERGVDGGGLGLMLSVWAVGTLAGAVASARARSGRLGRRMLAGGLAFGICLGAAAVTPWLVVFGILGFLVGAAYSMVSVAYVTLRAASSPDAMLGRIASLARTVTIGVQPLGMLAGGLLLDAVGGSVTLLLMGGGAAAAAIGFGSRESLRAAEVTTV